MQISIIIINYNVKYFLEQCLCSVEKAMEGIAAEVIVIDNASTDGSIAYLQPRFTRVRFVANQENLGFGKANNQGWKIARGDYILFLNPDTILAEDGLQNCLRFMDKHPRAGACGVRMLDGSGRFLPESKRGFPGLAASFFKLSGLTALFPRSKTLAAYYVGDLDEKQNHAVDVLSGAFLITRKEVLQQTGGFDEAFFMYGEDIDLSYRIQKTGMINYYVAETEIIHFKGESTKKESLNYVKTFYSAMEIFIKKHYPGAKHIPFRLFIRAAIYGRAGIAAISYLFPKREKKPVPGQVTTLLIGAESERQEAMTILARHPHPQRLIIHAGAETAALEAVATENIDEVIFCEGILSFKNIIQHMQEFPGRPSFKMHAAGTGSIVGSVSRDHGGDVLA